MYYRFQQTTGIETSLHVYPENSLLHLYKNKEAVSDMIKRIESQEVAWDDVASFDDLDNYFFKDGYVCCHYFDNEEDELKDEMKFDGSSVAAYDDYVMIFDPEESSELQDGHVAKVEKIVAIYKKKENKSNVYTRVK